jgi:hypothetical protein
MANLLTSATLASHVHNFRSLNAIDRLLAASTVAVVALTIVTAAWAVTSISHQLASPPRLSGYLASANTEPRPV